MTSTLSDLGNELAARVGFKPQAAYIGTMVGALFVKSARQLRDLPLTDPLMVGTVTMTAATDYALPSDFRSVVPDSAYMEDNTNPVLWVGDPAYWASLKATESNPGGLLVVRQIGNRLHVHNPINGTDLLFEYLSSYLWTNNAGNTAKERPTAENDKWAWDDELILLDVSWRYKREKGLDDWQIDAGEFKAYKSTLIGNQSGTGLVSFAVPEDWKDERPYTPLYVP